MSVIALKNWHIAMDGRCTSNGTILDDDYVKMSCFGPDKDIFLFYVGQPQFLDFFKQAYLTGKAFSTTDQTEINLSGIILENGKVFHCWVNQDTGTIVTAKIATMVPFAIGSGRDHAFTAMDMGATAVSSIKMAIQRDHYCGGTIRSWEFGFDPLSNKPFLKDLLIYKSKYVLQTTQVKE